MARYTRPSCRLCRREKIKLFLKGTKCETDKCPVSRRAYPPGQHGQIVTGLTLLQLLERRLDNIVFRMNLASSRPQARQLVQHGFVYINNKRVDIPSYTVKIGDEVSVKVKEPVMKRLAETQEILKGRAIPKWIELDAKNLKAKVIAFPTKEDIGFPIQEQLIVELYSK